MTVIDEERVSLYVKECSECGSTFTYRRVEVGFGNQVTCPVCGYGLYATFNEVKDELVKNEIEEKETIDEKILILRNYVNSLLLSRCGKRFESSIKLFSNNKHTTYLEGEISALEHVKDAINKLEKGEANIYDELYY